MKYLRYFENVQNDHTITEYISNLKLINVVDSNEWSISDFERDDETLKCIEFLNKNINLWVKMTDFVYKALPYSDGIHQYKIHFRYELEDMKGYHDIFDLNVSDGEKIDINILLDNAMIYYDNYVKKVKRILFKQGIEIETPYTYNDLIEYNKEMNKYKEEYDYLFSGEDMGLL